jgi:hypothetical protein
MNQSISDFIRSRKIDSIQKLNLLLFLYQNPGTQGTSRYFAKKLYLGDTRLVETIIRELTDRGVINDAGQHYFLADTPDIKSSLYLLANSFEYPLTRQKLLAQVQSGDHNGTH